MGGFLANKSLLSPTVTRYSGGTASFTLPQSGSTNSTQVLVGGVEQVPGVDFNVTGGTTLALTTSAPAGANMVCARQYFADGIVNTPADNSVSTSKIANDSVTGAKLNPALVQGDLIYADGTDTINRLAKGTASQQLAMNSGATAPEWIAPASSDFVKIVTVTASDSASIEFTSSHFDNSTYKSYQLILENLQAITTDGNAVYMRFSTDGGSSFLGDSSGFKYEGAYEGIDEAGTSRERLLPSNNEFRLTDDPGGSNVAGEDLSGSVWIINAGAALRTRILSWTNYADSGNLAGYFIGGAAMKDSEDTNGVKIFQNSGNISGSVTMYGIK